MGPAEPEVSTSAGRVRGRVEHGNAVFRGIPFAQPPLGELRFQAPQPVTSWDGAWCGSGLAGELPNISSRRNRTPMASKIPASAATPMAA